MRDEKLPLGSNFCKCAAYGVIVEVCDAADDKSLPRAIIEAWYAAQEGEGE